MILKVDELTRDELTSYMTESIAAKVRKCPFSYCKLSECET